MMFASSIIMGAPPCDVDVNKHQYTTTIKYTTLVKGIMTWLVSVRGTARWNPNLCVCVCVCVCVRFGNNSNKIMAFANNYCGSEF